MDHFYSFTSLYSTLCKGQLTEKNATLLLIANVTERS